MDAPTQEELIIMAVALHGTPRGRVTGTANGMRVIRQVLIWQDCWDPAEDLYNEDGRFTHPVYPALIQMALSDVEPKKIDGAGNLGTDMVWCSTPRYVGFGLTAFGWECADALFDKFPAYVRADDE